MNRQNWKASVSRKRWDYCQRTWKVGAVKTRITTTLERAMLVVTIVFLSPLATGATGLPFTSSFENGDFSEWNGGLDASLIVTPTDASDGRFAAQATMTRGQVADNYKEYVFGDHVLVRGDPVTPTRGFWLRFDSKFDSAFSFGSTANLHKIAIVNFEDENGRRRYQIVVNVWTATREYFVEHLKWNADRTFNRALPGLGQNVGIPAQVRTGQWDRLTLFLKPNTPGNMDGELLFFVNGQLKGEHRNISLREATTYNPNKLIMSNYVTDTSTAGIQKWDHFYLGESDPDAVVRPMPPHSLTAQ